MILDAAFLDAGERSAAERLAAKCGVAFAALWIEAPPKVMAARIAGRLRRLRFFGQWSKLRADRSKEA